MPPAESGILQRSYKNALRPGERNEVLGVSNRGNEQTLSTQRSLFCVTCLGTLLKQISVSSAARTHREPSDLEDSFSRQNLFFSSSQRPQSARERENVPVFLFGH